MFLGSVRPPPGNHSNRDSGSFRLDFVSECCANYCLPGMGDTQLFAQSPASADATQQPTDDNQRDAQSYL